MVMTKKQLIDTCMKLRPTAREWRDAVTRHVDYFEGHAGFDFENWEKDKFVEARGIVAGIMEKTVRYHIYGHSSQRVNRKLRKIANLMHAII